MNGWIKLHRALLDKPIWINSTPEQRTILITILLMVNHKPKKWSYKGNEIEIQSGQCVTSIQSIVDKCNSKSITTQVVRTALSRFEKLEFLKVKTNKKSSIITITNWSTYQVYGESGQQRHQQSEQQSEQQSDFDNSNKDKSAKSTKTSTKTKNLQMPINTKLSERGTAETNKDINKDNAVGATKTNSSEQQRHQQSEQQSEQQLTRNNKEIYKEIYNIQTRHDYINTKLTEVRSDGPDVEKFLTALKKNIDYLDITSYRETDYINYVNDVINLCVDLIAIEGNVIHIGSKAYPKDYVKEVLLKINYEVMEHIVEAIQKVNIDGKVKNVKAYVQAIIFNKALSYKTEFTSFFNGSYYGNHNKEDKK